MGKVVSQIRPKQKFKGTGRFERGCKELLQCLLVV